MSGKRFIEERREALELFRGVTGRESHKREKRQEKNVAKHERGGAV